MTTTTKPAVEAQADNPEPQSESTLKEAMLAKTAIRHSSNFPQPCIITVDESGVFFANANSLSSGLKFSLDEWNEIVAFVDYQVMTKDEACGWQPDWSMIDAQYNYLARDEDDDEIYAFVSKPTMRGDYWDTRMNDHVHLEGICFPDDIDYTTLFVRPGFN